MVSDKFQVEILLEVTDNQIHLNEYECKFISMYIRFELYPNGYNLSSGGRIS